MGAKLVLKGRENPGIETMLSTRMIRKIRCYLIMNPEICQDFYDPFPPAFFVFYLCLGPSRKGVSAIALAGIKLFLEAWAVFP
jgi:hypothetical protein